MLQKGVSRVRLPSSLMRLLLHFVLRAEELVTREEIAELLWSAPESVDTTSGINTAVNRLRYALGDRPAKPIYIETVVGAGYRFIAPVEWDEASAAAERAPVVTPSLLQFSDDEEALELQQELKPRTETTSPTAPSQASQPYVFESTGERNQSTLRPAAAFWIALVILTAAAVGFFLWEPHKDRATSTPSGARRFKLAFVQATFNDVSHPVSASSISPDGRMLAFSDPQNLTLRILDRHSESVLPFGRPASVVKIAWLPDSSGLIVSCQDLTNGPQIWFAPLSSAQPRLLVNGAAGGIPAPDGEQLAFTRKDGSEIWVSSLRTGAARRVGAADQVQFSSLLWSSDGTKLLAQERRIPDPDPASSPGEAEDRSYRWRMTVFDAATGTTLSKRADLKTEAAVVLKDGRLLYLEKESDATELKVVSLDPRDETFVTEPRLLAKYDRDRAFSLSASSDGSTISVTQNLLSTSVFFADLHLSPVRLTGISRLKHVAHDNYPHAWNATGDAIFFESNDLGPYAIYKQTLGDPISVLMARSPSDSIQPEVSPDGRWVLFEDADLKRHRILGLYRVPEGGGRMERIFTTGAIDSFDCSATPQGRCVLRERVGSEFVYYDLDPVAGMGKELGRTNWVSYLIGDWSLSSDGSVIVTVTHDPNNPGLRFYPFRSYSNRIPDIPIIGLGDPLEVHELPNGKGYLVETSSREEHALLFTDRAGHTTVLQRSPTSIWGVPSRQNKIAYPALVENSNVWIARADPALTD